MDLQSLLLYCYHSVFAQLAEQTKVPANCLSNEDIRLLQECRCLSVSIFFPKVERPIRYSTAQFNFTDFISLDYTNDSFISSKLFFLDVQ
jgi:hypothetical protein